jgi:hypothetical protein
MGQSRQGLGRKNRVTVAIAGPAYADHAAGLSNSGVFAFNGSIEILANANH